MKHTYWLLAVPAAVCLLAGCSGGGSSTNSVGTVQTANVSGQVRSPQNGALSTTLRAKVAGTTISAPIQANGSFSLTGVAVGTQTITIVDASDSTQTPLSSEMVTITAGANIIPPLPAPSTFTSASNSGIAGIVMEGPIRPAAINGVPNEQPYAGATLDIKTTSGALSAAVVSKTDGTFSVQVAPGDYQIVPLPGPNGFPHANPFQVTVKANETTNVEVDYDTGIR